MLHKSTNGFSLNTGEKSYYDCSRNHVGVFCNNPYKHKVMSPFGYYNFPGTWPRVNANYYALSVKQTIGLNATLNTEAQAAIDAREPRENIWEFDELNTTTISRDMDTNKGVLGDEKQDYEAQSDVQSKPSDNSIEPATKKRFSMLKALGMKSTEERKAARFRAELAKAHASWSKLRNQILQEEEGRWPDENWRSIVAAYQDKVGMTHKTADLRLRFPIQYLHLLRAGYFEPIPVAWANSNSNPLKFSIEAAGGWRGITPAWRGFEDTAEERLYWVLNHREGSHAGTRLKPDTISALEMARKRMASAVPPPPDYYSANDTCHVQHTSEGYSNQVMPRPFKHSESSVEMTGDTMILLDVSGSMGFEPVRPVYNDLLITGWARSTQPRNKGISSEFCTGDGLLTPPCIRCRQSDYSKVH